MTESVIQTKEGRWSGPEHGVLPEKDMSQGLGVSLVLSVLAHVLFGAIIVMALLHSGAPPSAPHPTRFDLEVVEFVDPVPVEHEAEREAETQHPEIPEAARAQEPATEALPAPRREATHWRPFDPDRKSAVDLEQLIKLAACPRFADPSDLRLSGKCAERAPGSINRETSTEAAAKIAAAANREAVKHGWVVAARPEPPAQIKAALEPSAKTPGEEVFGPWPWDAGR